MLRKDGYCHRLIVQPAGFALAERAEFTVGVETRDGSIVAEYLPHGFGLFLGALIHQWNDALKLRSCDIAGRRSDRAGTSEGASMT